MSSKEDRTRAQGKGLPGSLGELLYAHCAAPTLEQEWLDIVRAIGAGDQDALHALYQRTHRIVFALVLRITNSRETADEVTVDVFHDIWRRAATYDAAGGTVVGWIMNQARSRAIDRVRFEQRKKRVASDGHDSAPDAVDDAHAALAERERGTLLRSAIATLTAGERQAIETAFFSGLTYAEVAERLELPLGTIKTRVRSGLGKLRQALGTRREEL